MATKDIKWIKISSDIFDDDAFKLIDAMPEADAIELIWFKLLVFAGASNNQGVFLFKDKIAYTDEMLSAVFHRPLNTVRLALKTFEELGMIEQIDNVYAIPNWSKYQNLDAYEKKKERDRIYQQERRERQKLMIEEKKSSDNRPTVGRDCSYSNSISNSLSNSKDNNTNNNTKDTKKNSNKNYIYYPNDEKLNQTFLDYMDMRKKIKSPMTDRAVTLAMNTLEKLSGGDNDKAIAILEQSIMNSWKGLFELKDSVYSSRTNNQQSQLERILNA